MRQWNLTAQAPLSLRLAADARQTTPDYADDQIWELKLGQSETDALLIETSYGLRASAMQLYPSFSWRGEPLVDPSLFAESPRVELVLPNYVRLRTHPFHDLQVTAEYWVADSRTLLGRINLLNQGDVAGDHHLRLHAHLDPGPDGSGMAERHLAGVSLLTGQTADLQPLVFLSGGAVAETSAKPALGVRHQLAPGQAQSVFWAHIGGDDPGAALARAREFAGSNWEAQVARLERSNDTWVQIYTGDEARDAVFAACQQVGLRLLMGASHLLPQPSFVLRRTPDDGYSARGDGRDYEAEWSGQEAMGAYQLGRLLLPIAPESVKGWLRNYIYVQQASGEIDARPGLAGQRAGLLCPPLLATLAREVCRAGDDDEFAREVFDPLVQFVESWFGRRHDRDGDGAPEWDNPLQTGYAESPTFVRWANWGQGLDIRVSESPDLLAYLLRECRSLIELGQRIGRSEVVAELEARATGLRQALDRSWDEQAGTYRHLDRDLHLATAGERLGGGKGDCTVKLGGAYDPMVRLVIRVEGPEAEAGELEVTVHGRGPKGQFRSERLDRAAFQWYWELGTATTQQTFARLDRVEVKHAAQSFRTEVHRADFRRRDLSLLLPLWAGAVDSARAERMIDDSLLEPSLHWREQGLSACAADDPAYDPEARPFACGVRMVWNVMLGQALLDYGRREEAAQLVLRLLAAAQASLSREGGFRELYHPDQPAGFGGYDHVAGLFPVRLFLEVLGVQLVSPWKLELTGGNPFPWPVRVNWRGLTVDRPLQGPTSVRFPDGYEAQIEPGEGRAVERVRGGSAAT